MNTFIPHMLDEFPVFLSRNPTQWRYFHVADMYSSNMENHAYANDHVCVNAGLEGTGWLHYSLTIAYSSIARASAIQNESERQESEWENPEDT